MKLLFGFLLAAGLVLALSGPIAERIQDNNAYQRERQALELARQRDALERERAWNAATAPANVALYYGAGAGGFVFLALLVAFLRDGSARRARAFELVDVHGYPLARRQLEESDGWTLELMARAMELDKAAKLAEASRALPPHALTYAPRISGQDAPALVDTAAAALATVPSFADLLTRGEIGAGRPLVLGAGASGLVTGSFRDLYSTLVAGQSGTGKSTTQRFFASQAALHDGRFIVIDPHADAGEDSLAATLAPLQSRYMCEVADNERTILDAVKLARDIGEQRLHGQDADRRPILIWCDEATGLLGHSKIGPELAELLELVAQQLRKVGIFCSISAQIVTANRTGGDSALRDSMASVICHKMRRSQARLILPLDDAATVERLEPGRAVLWRTSGASELVGIPQTTSADCVEVARRLQCGSSVAPARGHDGLLSELLGARTEPERSRNGAGSSATGRGEALSAESARVLGLFRGGADISAIVRELYGVTSANGSKYQKLAGEVQTLLRQALQQ